jgi:hypothetical protein
MEDIELMYTGSVVKQEKTVIGLVIVLDYRLTLNLHLGHLSQNALKGIEALKYAAHRIFDNLASSI